MFFILYGLFGYWYCILDYDGTFNGIAGLRLELDLSDTRGLLVVVGTDMRGMLVAIGFDS